MYFRPTKVDILFGDATKARKIRGWQPQVGLEELMQMIIESDLKEAEHEAMCLRENFSYNGCRQQIYPASLA